MPKPLSFPTFLLKTIYFSPIANPLYPVLGVVLVILAASGDLTKHMVLFALFASGLSGMIIGPFLCISEHGKGMRINPSVLLLPIELKDVFKKALVSGVLYGIIITSILLVLAATKIGLPHVQHLGITFVDTPGKAKLSVATGFVYDVSGRISEKYREVLDPSLIFGIVTTTRGYPVFPGWQLLLFLLFASSTAYFISATVFKPFMRRKNQLRIVHVILLMVYFFLGSIIIADMLAGFEAVWHWRSWLDIRPWIVPAITLFAGLLFSGGTLLQYHECKNAIPE